MRHASVIQAPAALNFGTAAGVDPAGASKGIAVLLEGAGAGQEYNTTTSKVGVSGAAQHFSAMIPVTDSNNNAIVDGTGKEVWAVLTTSARNTTATNYSLRFYSGSFKSGNEVAYTMAQDFKFAYPKIFDLSDLGTWDEWGTALVDKEAAQLAPGQITAAELAADSVTSAKIADGAVGTSELADAGVSTAKLANGAVTSAKIAAGAVGATELAANSVDAGKIVDGSVGTAELATGAVTSAKIAAGAVGSAEIADGSVGTAELANGAVTSAKLAAGAVGATELAGNSVDASKIVDGSVGTAELANDAVTAAKIGAAAVESAKLHSAVKDRVGGGWDAIVKTPGNGSNVNFDLAHTDAELAEEAVLITVAGLVMEETVDFTFENGTGAGGVDRIVFVAAPAAGAKVIMRYRRTSL